ncbi:MAG TPA: hypothetical protein VJ785_01530 [Anaerolineales bacterium]|nr:hypothetical protein [Anaerolineales bacterium]
MELIRNRFPDRKDVLAVFGIVVFVCYSWSLLGFLNELSSFLLYFTVTEIGNIFAFMMAFALLESLAVTGFLYLLSAILPSGWLRDGFALKGFVIIIIATATSILFQRSLDEYPSALILAATVLVPFVLTVAVILALRSLPRIKNILVNIQDRILIMLVIYVPIGLLSFGVVLYRNLL